MNSTERLSPTAISANRPPGAAAGMWCWSSSMDTALKLATEYAEQYASPEVKQLPDWAVWQQKAYGTTYEPVVFIYNKRLIPQNEGSVCFAPTALAKLIASQADRLKGKVTTYDIEKSGLGFMLAVQDSQADAELFCRPGEYRQRRPDGAVFHRHNDGARLLRRKP
ncbi:hypothetical protein MJK72_16825 [Klebsiella pneumoniae]|nr:hypothetical protein MJK72_16825 [Klebsiella pneumoniae]